MNKNYIGVFDSGLGGLSVLKDLSEILPSENFLYYGDSKNAPYGIKTREAVIERCFEICDYFMDKTYEGGSCKAIVVACNTATSAAIQEMRDKYPVPVIGIEPALKVACDGKTNQNVIVMATEFTLKEKKFADLMEKYSKENNIVKLPCPELVEIVEHKKLTNKKLIENELSIYFKLADVYCEDVDSVVLGCTHFIFFRDYINKFFAGKANIIDGNRGTAMQLKNVLSDRGELEKSGKGRVQIENSSDDTKIMELSWELFNK